MELTVALCVVSVDVDSALCSCMHSASAHWSTQCFTVRALLVFVRPFLTFTLHSAVKTMIYKSNCSTHSHCKLSYHDYAYV